MTRLDRMSVPRVLVDSRISRRRMPAVHVAHRSDGGWIFGGAGFTDRSIEGFVAKSIADVIEIDPELEHVLDLPRGSHAWRRGLGDAWTRARLPFGDVHLLTFETLGFTPSTRGVGAFVHAWVKRRSLAAARRIALRAVRESGFRVVRVEQEGCITLADCRPGGRKYFRQAEIDGEVLLFNRFPATRTRPRARRARRSPPRN